MPNKFFNLSLVIISIFFLTACRNETNSKFELPTTFNQITNINISYNGGQDKIMIDIPNNIVHYYAYDAEGNRLNIENELPLPSEFANYYMSNILSQIKNNDSCNNIPTSYYEIITNLTSTSSFTYCKEEQEPDWFKDMLDILQANKYGYLTPTETE